jgi:hypothetical protein
MAIRSVKQKTDRGNIKDLARSSDLIDSDMLPTSIELRLKKLYEYSQLNKDNDLQSALGFITTDYISDKNALPLSIYRIRQIVENIKSTSSDKIDKLSQELSGYISDELSSEAIDFLNKKRILNKTASSRKAPSFWRASKK